MMIEKEATYYKNLDDDKAQCFLCPHNCIIKNGKSGICRVRTNNEGRLIADTFGQVSSMAFDPIEKKPLYHFFPGSEIFSVGSVGCNLHCSFCQNCEISQTSVADFPYLKQASFESIVQQAQKRSGNIGIAFTYNEPTVWFEFMLDIAKQAKLTGLKTAMISNGFINLEPLQQLLPYIDAFNIDLKGFTEKFYENYTSSHLEPVKETLNLIAKSGKHLEITNLLIPILNDNLSDFSDMLDWIRDELGRDVPLHLSRYFPRHKLTIDATSPELMLEYYEYACGKLNFVYLGNLHGRQGSDTYCPGCKNTIITRSGYRTEISGLENNGQCCFCGKQVLPEKNMKL
ncbi:MAG: AmmeMemoRadiSam system radical SAM enzyme [Bacteroidales bacterium]|nr:AmmeMemoRadiSam system radical SAM enzyme [Bacteroidales bacterium]MCF8454915.1 AmmeMemoRadiSam system radical SAM enzyme [Bacteroidales bacterium]